MEYKFRKYKKAEIKRNHLNMGGSNPAGERIDVTSLYLTRNEKPWIGVMGEYHFNRAKREDWYQELCKMKAGGLGIAATYLFWNYHEEEEGVFDFSGDRDIRHFVLEAQKAEMDVIIRIGPWAHGECRYGGFPDWLLKKDFPLRENNPQYLKLVEAWYGEIYEQVRGLFYKDGGNIIGIQFENELVDQPEHLTMLKEIALKIGFEAPLYTVTGWNSLYGAKIPVNEVMPVFGGYVEAPWEQHTDPLPLNKNYIFDPMRNDAAIGTDIIGKRSEDGWRLPYDLYPYATCELGAGLQPTHHRRPVVSGMDAYILSLVKLGCGNNLVGYYMYHGGTNKIGKFSTLQESRATGYPNDYTILNYDFHTALSEYGEARTQYGLLNQLHLFINSFGEYLAPMEYAASENYVTADNLQDLRYCMRTDGYSGFVFVNHYQRLAKIEDVKKVVFDTGIVRFPEIDVCGENGFFLPFHMKLESEILRYATAQPLCRVENTYFFMKINGIEANYCFEDETVYRVEAGLDSKLEKGSVRIVTLTQEQAQYARMLSEHLYIGRNCNVYEYENKISCIENGGYAYYEWTGTNFKLHTIEQEYTPAMLEMQDIEEPFVPLYETELNLGENRKRKWKHLAVTGAEGFIEINEKYDAAQIYADGEMTADSFYCGEPWRIPAKLLYGKECYLVMSEWKEDHYREWK